MLCEICSFAVYFRKKPNAFSGDNVIKKYAKYNNIWEISEISVMTRVMHIRKS
jgi:hypothetical protein